MNYKYKAGDLVALEDLPERVYGDRRDGMFCRVRLFKGSDASGWAGGSSFVMELERGLRYVGVHKCSYEGIKELSKMAIGFEEWMRGCQAYSMPVDPSLFECMAGFCLKYIGYPRNKSDFSMFEALYSKGVNDIAHAVKISDWGHVDTNATCWWEGVRPFGVYEHNELARNALWWYQQRLAELEREQSNGGLF